MATPLAIINLALDLIGDDNIATGNVSQNTYAKNVVTGFNFILRDIYKRNPRWASLSLKTTFDTVVDQAAYDLSQTAVANPAVAKLSQIQSITHPDNYLLKKINRDTYQEHLLTRDYDDDDGEIADGEPIYYYASEKLLNLYPIPNTVKTLSVWYKTDLDTAISAANGNLENVDIVPFEESELNMLVAGIAWMAAIRLQDFNTAGFWQNEYRKAIILNTLDEDEANETLELDPYFSDGLI